MFLSLICCCCPDADRGARLWTNLTKLPQALDFEIPPRKILLLMWLRGAPVGNGFMPAVVLFFPGIPMLKP